ncbi:septal ring lytic transglycosylase RlpA family protein [Pelagibacterium halotolerans]|uniref:septal ring lytic transglycosylase RlpA family protein n=1 Tax=Pelagibacterium halotolerans TaxID=531813 RepID=UPI00384D23EC
MMTRRVLPLCFMVITAAFAALSLSSALSAQTATQCGDASWYAIRNTTASGEMMNPDALTAAHRTLPFGTMVNVLNRDNGEELTLRINDRGPFISGRIIDVSRAAANQLGFRTAGVADVCLTIMS